jgi:hypothetical protein
MHIYTQICPIQFPQLCIAIQGPGVYSFLSIISTKLPGFEENYQKKALTYTAKTGIKNLSANRKEPIKEI